MDAFDFNPADYRSAYQSRGYVHIAGGVSQPFLQYAQAFHRQCGADLPEFKFKGKKQQFLFEFPVSECLAGIKDMVASVTGLDRARLTLCERHIKAYETSAKADPPPHKDRVASEVAVGLPLIVGEGSEVVIYPDDELTINPFNSTALWRSSLDEEQLPEKVLAGKRSVSLNTQPGDVLMFRGSSLYHERKRAAGTVVLYLKFNAMRLDPLGEDDGTEPQRRSSLSLLEGSSDEQLLALRVEPSPRLHRISRHYTRLHWKEQIQAYITGAKELTLNEEELSLIKLADGKRTIGAILRMHGTPEPYLKQWACTFRRLVRLQVLDLLD